MKTKAIIPLIVGVGIGLLALKMGWSYIDKQKRSVEASQGDTPVVVAKVDIAPGTLLKASDFKVVDWPRATVPSQSFRETEKLVGRVSTTALTSQLPVLENMLAPPGTPPGLQALVPAGYQAMSIKVDEFKSVAGFLKPGDKVDVVATFSVKRTKSGGTETVTRTILRDIAICAVGGQVQPDENNQPMVVRSITLLVKPDEAQKLSLASTRGTITLALCSGQGPSTTEDLTAISFAELLQPNTGQGDNPLSGLIADLASQNKSVEDETDPHWRVQIWRGSNIQELVFNSPTSSQRVTPTSAQEDGSQTQLPSGNPADWSKQDIDKFSKLLGQKSSTGDKE